ncbi:MAG: MGMT family protein [Thermoplasmata archaeon]
MPSLAKIRAVIARIPRGKVITYGQVAAAAGFPRAARLTVRALQTAEGLPWHRVVGAGGRIALLGEEGREQRLRLELEGVSFRGLKVRMDLHGWTPRSRRHRTGRAHEASLGRERDRGELPEDSPGSQTR